MSTTPTLTEYCAECGSTDLLQEALIALNDPEDVRTFDTVTCEDCEGETTTTTTKPKETNK